jgi:hypothetical protein
MIAVQEDSDPVKTDEITRRSVESPPIDDDNGDVVDFVSPVGNDDYYS